MNCGSNRGIVARPWPASDAVATTDAMLGQTRAQSAFFGALALLGATAFGSCSDDNRRHTRTPVVESEPTLRLLVVTDLKGYLEPCGCTSRPLGGIDRLAAAVARERQRGAVLFVAAGDTFFASDGDHGDLHGAAATQEQWKAETLVDILDEMDLDAVTVGPGDFGLGVDTLRALAGRADFPILAANVRQSAQGDPADPIFIPRQLRSIGGTKIGLFGVADLGTIDGLTEVDDFRAAARRQAEALRGQGAEVLVALVRGSRRGARQVAQAIAGGPAFVIHAGIDSDDAVPPSTVEDAVLLHASRQGQGLVVADLYIRGGGRFADASVWTREAAAAELTRQIEDLGARIAAWENDPEVEARDLETQRGRLARLTAERDDAQSGQPPDAGNYLRARFVELTPDATRSPNIGAMVEAYDARVNEHNRTALADLRPPPVAEGQASYIGSASCATCHEGADRWWRQHAHGRAYQTLVERNKEFNLSCVGCHVTGYGQPGGSTVTHNLDGALVNVGCESCHGPGSAHVAAPESAGLVALSPPETICLRCHNEKHSDRFNFVGYRAMLMAPGHGLPETAAPAADRDPLPRPAATSNATPAGTRP